MPSTFNLTILVRRGIDADMPTLASGEFGLGVDTGNLYIGTPSGNILIGGGGTGGSLPAPVIASAALVSNDVNEPEWTSTSADNEVLLGGDTPDWGLLTHLSVAADNIDGTVSTPSLRTLGTGATQACAGNDPRLSDPRTPVGTTLTAGNIWVGNASNLAAAVAMSGHATISSTGAITLSSIVSIESTTATWDWRTNSNGSNPALYQHRRRASGANLVNGDIIGEFLYMARSAGTDKSDAYLQAVYTGDGTTRGATWSVYCSVGASAVETLRVGAGTINLPQLTASRFPYIDASKNIIAIDAATTRTNLGLGSLATKSTIASTDIDNDAVTYAKMQNVSATDRVLGRSSTGAGDVEEITCTAAGRALIDDADAAAQRTTLGLGSLATASAVTEAQLPTPSNGSSVGGYTITASSAWEDTGLSVTLPSAGTYLLMVRGRAVVNNNTVGATVNVRLYNTTDSAAITNSEHLCLRNQITGAAVTNPFSFTVPITVSASKTIRLEVQRSAVGTYTTSNLSSDTTGQTAIAYIRIGGN